MSAEHARKVIGWFGFSVLLPILVYPAAALIASFSSRPFTLEDALAKGDLLLLVIALLATTLNMTVTDFLLMPRTQAVKQWFGYVCFVFMILSVLFYGMMYGWIITTRMPGAPPLEDPGMIAVFTGVSIVAFTVFCGAQYYHLLRSGRV